MEKCSKKNHSLNLYHMKFCQNCSISWCLVWIIFSLWKGKNFKAPLCLPQSHILLSGCSKLPEKCFFASLRTLEEEEKTGFIIQRTCHSATARMCQASTQTALLNLPIKNVQCWARYKTFSQDQHLTSFLFYKYGQNPLHFAFKY